MINTYKNISIIYGGSGKEYAQKIDKELKRRHLDEFYPIKSHILANAILNSTAIIESVKEIISASCACVIILTFDDIENTRVRQNVLIEIGMALMMVDKSNCFFLSDRKKLPDDFPSDLHFVNPNYIDPESPDATVIHTCDEIIRHLGISDYRNILTDDNYIYDYTRVLDDIPAHIFEEKADVQLDHILDEWEKNISSFEFASERIIYLAERLKFFPIFNNNERFFEFLRAVKQLILPSQRDFALFGKEYLVTVCDFIRQIIDYTEIKLNETVLEQLANPEAHREQIARRRVEFKEIADNLREFIEDTEDGVCPCNWLLRVLAYEYAGLAYMKYLKCVDKLDERHIPLMNDIIGFYKKAIRTGKVNDPYSNTLWLGYSQFNLTRAFENLYKISKNSEYLDNMKSFSEKSITTRHSWFFSNPFKGVFSNALSYEYFLVCKHEFDLRYKYSEYAALDEDTDLLDGLASLKKELSLYCESSGIGRLYDMRNRIDDLIKQVRQEG